MPQEIFKKIDYPLHLRKSILSLALEAAHLNSNIKATIINKKIKLEYYERIKKNVLEAKGLLGKLEKEYLKEIEDKTTNKKLKNKETSLLFKLKARNSFNNNLMSEINEIREKLARL